MPRGVPNLPWQDETVGSKRDLVKSAGWPARQRAAHRCRLPAPSGGEEREGQRGHAADHAGGRRSAVGREAGAPGAGAAMARRARRSRNARQPA